MVVEQFFEINLKLSDFNFFGKKRRIGVAGLRSPCLPHAKGVLYQVSYNPEYSI